MRTEDGGELAPAAPPALRVDGGTVSTASSAAPSPFRTRAQTSDTRAAGAGRGAHGGQDGGGGSRPESVRSGCWAWTVTAFSGSPPGSPQDSTPVARRQ